MARLDRKGNTIKGALTGMVFQAFNILAPFVVRTVFIHTLSVEYLGLNSLLTSILQVLNLAELGVGSALVFSMYAPIATDDEAKVCALMRLYRTYYRAIGVVVLVIGLALIPFLPLIVSGDVPAGVDMYSVYLLRLSATVVSYWLFAYRNSILNAYQKDYVINAISLAVNAVMYVGQLMALLVARDYYLFLIATLVGQVVLNIVTAVVSKRMYPQYAPVGKIDEGERRQINRKVLNLFAAKVCGVVTNSADSLVISAFLGLAVLGVYNNYYLILTSVMAMIGVIFNSYRAGLGNALILETEDRNVEEFKALTCVVSFLVCVCLSCLLNLYQPFIALWAGSGSLLDWSSVVLICLYFLSYEYPIFWATYKDAAGVWREDRTRSIVCPLLNLVLNIALVSRIGLNGVLISTIVTYAVVSGPWLLVIVRKHVLSFDLGEYATSMARYLAVILVAAGASWGLCEAVRLGGVMQLAYNLAVSLIVSSGLFSLFFWRSREFIKVRGMLHGMLPGGRLAR